MSARSDGECECPTIERCAALGCPHCSEVMRAVEEKRVMFVRQFQSSCTVEGSPPCRQSAVTVATEQKKCRCVSVGELLTVYRCAPHLTKRLARVSHENALMLAMLSELLEWNVIMGKWDSTCWERARKLRDRLLDS